MRSRVRRIARDVFRNVAHEFRACDILLAAREDLGLRPRRDLRSSLWQLFERASGAVDGRSSP